MGIIVKNLRPPLSIRRFALIVVGIPLLFIVPLALLLYDVIASINDDTDDIGTPIIFAAAVLAILIVTAIATLIGLIYAIKRWRISHRYLFVVCILPALVVVTSVVSLVVGYVMSQANIPNQNRFYASGDLCTNLYAELSPEISSAYQDQPFVDTSAYDPSVIAAHRSEIASLDMRYLNLNTQAATVFDIRGGHSFFSQNGPCNNFKATMTAAQLKELQALQSDYDALVADRSQLLQLLNKA